MVFCTVFLLTIPLIPYFYLLFIFIICCTKSEIHKFMTPKPFLQLKCVLLIYRPKNCVYTNCIVPIKYLRHQIDRLYSALLSYLVNGSGVAKNIDSLITTSILIRFLHDYNHWIRIYNTNPTGLLSTQLRKYWCCYFANTKHKPSFK